jgi:hypothetical protein
MPLQASWVDNLFARLTVRYGAAFLRQWPDADLAVVKADWADVLDGCRGESIGYALRYLPNTPPNALQFRDVCRRAPEPELPRLPAPEVPKERRAEAMALIRAALAGSRTDESTAAKCIRNIERIAAQRGYMTGAQKQQVEACRRVLRATEAPDDGKRLTQERVDEYLEENAAW